MKKHLLMLFMVFYVVVLHAQQKPIQRMEHMPNAIVPDSGYMAEFDTYTSDEVDVAPKFPGGEAMLKKYIARHVKYRAINEMQTFIVFFKINEKGKVIKVYIPKGQSDAFLDGVDQETINAVMSFPRWEPGKENGQRVSVWCHVKIGL